jgi:site-specific DNA recombinase
MPGHCPREKLERLVTDQLQSRVLTDSNLEELVKLVNDELRSASSGLKDRLDICDAELRDVQVRLSQLYDVLETGKLSLEELTPRIRELRSRQDELSKTRIQIEADMVAQGVDEVDINIVRSYTHDLKSLLEESEITEKKTFLRSFIKRIDINKDKATVHYHLPLPNNENRKVEAEVLPIVTSGGDRGIRTPNLRDANAALSQLSYIPMTTGLL